MKTKSGSTCAVSLLCASALVGVGACLSTASPHARKGSTLHGAGARPTDDHPNLTLLTPLGYRNEWRASTFSSSKQAESSLAIDDHGDLITVWSSRRQQGGTYGVYARRFTTDGAALSAEMPLNLWTRSHQSAPAVASAGGTTWAVWQSHRQDGHAGAIIARRFDQDFTGGPEIRVNQLWRGHQARPVVAVSPKGGAVIVWTSTDSEARGLRIRARLFDAVGQPLTNEFAVGASTDRSETTPSVVWSADNQFAVAFGVSDGELRPAGIRLRLFDGDGNRLGREIEVASRGQQIEPVIAASTNGYVIAWLDSDRGSSHYRVIARRFDVATGAPLGEPIPVDDGHRESSQTAAAVAALRDGGFVIAWNGRDQDGGGVFARHFAQNGDPLSDRFRLNSYTAGQQAMTEAVGTTRLVVSRRGEVITVWNGDAGLGDASSVNVSVASAHAPLLETGTRHVPPESVSPFSGKMKQQVALPHKPPTFNLEDMEDPIRSGEPVGAGGGFTGIFSTGWNPPDPHMGVGPDHVVVMTNGAIAFFTKTGTLTFQDQIEGGAGFWGSLGATGFVFDPEVVFDELSGRFFAMASDADFSTDRSYALLAVSDDSDPNGTWHKYRFETTALAGGVFDSPNIGVDQQAVYLTGDGFGGPAAYPVFIFDKASLLNGDPPAIVNSLPLATSTQSAGIPPVSFDNPPALYMIEHKEAFNNSQVRLIALRDPLGSPFFTEALLTVPNYGRPEDPPQAGTSMRPETFDARFWSVAYRNGSLWATHHINSSRVLARWYEIAMNGWPVSGSNPELVQSGEIDAGPDDRTFFSAITVDDHGNAMITFAHSSPSDFISMATAMRYESDPLGTFNPMVIHQTNNGPFFSDRWGDYGAVNVDPIDDITFWAHHEYAQNDSWRTWIQPLTPVFDPADLDFDGQVGAADLAMLLAAWGPCPMPCTPGDPADTCPADLNGDCEVGAFDLASLLAAWGK